ncbi:MAG: energy-coupled thiamine transporter ThiT [Lachnospiraceae bacterium]|nr:energy-coupled thiamine transporter ThiT [Lachnospiraceae bacterium]
MSLLSTFVTFNSENEAYELVKPGGYVALVVLLLVSMLLTIFIADKKQEQTGKKVSAKQLAFCGISLALAFVISSVPFLKFELPYGGSVTILTMFMICYTGYLFGARVGLLTAFAFSLLQFFGDGSTYILSPFQVCCDYFFAFTALGIAGLWSQKKHGMVIGFITGCILRGLFHTIGGYLYWMDYMPENFPQSLAKLYPVVYNYSYILAEMILTLVVLQIPVFKKALARIEQMVTA